MRPRPGPIDLRSPAFKDDPRPTWRRLHDGPAVIVTRQPLLGRVALAVHHAEATAVLQDGERFALDARRLGHRSAAGMRWWVPRPFAALADNMLTRDGDEHRALRARVDSAFQRPRLEALQPRIDALADEAVASLARSPDGDFVRHVARPVPQRVITELLGLGAGGEPRTRSGRAEEARANAALERALGALGDVHGPLDLFRVVPAVRLISAVLRVEIASRRREPRDDLLSVLVDPRGVGRALADDELLSMVFLLYVAGHETTTHLMSTAVLTLLREPGLQERARESSLDVRAVTELLRWLSPVQMGKPRFVSGTLELGGVALRRGDTVAPLVACANMDPRWVEDGYALDLARRPGRHLAFGAGPHVCLGLQLALRETRAVLESLLAHGPDLGLARPDDVPDWTRRLGMRVLASLPLARVGRTPAR